MKVFISQPMNGLTKEEIFLKRKEIYNKFIHDSTKKDIEIIDSYIENPPFYYNAFDYIADSIRKMKDADMIIFAKGWENNKGCKIEYEVWKAYKNPDFIFFCDC